MTNQTTTAMLRAAEILTANAKSLRETHTLHPHTDWSGEEAAKASHDEMVRLAETLRGASNPNERIQVEQTVKRSHVLVPLRMTRAMIAVTDMPDWTWEDLLAAAETITEQEYQEIAEAPEPQDPRTGEVSGT